MFDRFVRDFLPLLLVFTACGGKDDPDPDDEPTAKEVCAAACANFSTCGSDSPTCASDCEAGIAFMAQNNPGTECAAHETGRMDCLAGLTCDELDVYFDHPDDPARPCQEWVDLESEMCAIE